MWLSVLRMSEYGIMSSDELVSFGQLFGMCDPVSFSLGKTCAIFGLEVQVGLSE